MINFEGIDTPTIEEAEQFFKLMRCSYFHMAREYPIFYDKYIKMGIPNKIENRWRQELFNECNKLIMESQVNEKMWILYSQIVDLSSSIETIDNLKIVLNTTKYLASHSLRENNILIGEIIIGRADQRYKDGLIYRVNKINREMAIEYVKLANHFIHINNNEKDSIDRCIDSEIELKQIIMEEKLF